MKLHSVNMDAIRAGARGLLINWPAAPEVLNPPRGVHKILWLDDFARGVALMRECIHRAMPEHGLAHQQLVCQVVLGDADDIDVAQLDGDAIETLSALWANLDATGDPERYGADHPGDHEMDFDEIEEARSSMNIDLTGASEPA